MRSTTFLTLLDFPSPIFTQLSPTSKPASFKSIKQLFDLDSTYHVDDPFFTNSRNLALNLPGSCIFFNPALSTFDDRSTAYLKQNLPSTLKQFDIPAAQIPGMVDEGIPLVLETVKEMLAQLKDEGHGLRTRELDALWKRRSIMSWVGYLGCGLVAAAGFGLYAIAAADYTVANSGRKLIPSPFCSYFLFFGFLP